MTLRALLIGLLLGLLVSSFTFFNDAIIQQSWFISNHLPISVFGVIVLLLLGLNPVLGAMGRNLSLTVPEVAIIAAIGLAACGWPSFSFYWGFVPNTATPIHWARTSASWQANHVMSYVPGASAELGRGHVRDWTPIVDAVLAAEGDDGHAIPAQIWRQLGPREREALRSFRQRRSTDGRDVDAIRLIFNGLIREAALTPPADALHRAPTADDDGSHAAAPRLAFHPLDRARSNRRLLVSAFSRQVLPMPEGEGVIVAGRPGTDAVVDMVVQGRDSRDRSMFAVVPWSTWWPTLRLWGSLALLLGAGSFCLALIVHPQWSRRELLAYPLAQFVAELSRHDGRGVLPDVARCHLFWMGLLTAAGIHLVNGLNAWFPDAPAIPLHLGLGPLGELFPTASRVTQFGSLLNPYLYLSVIAFAFFLNTTISFSVGIATFAFVAFAATMIAGGVAVENDYFGPSPINLVRFGSYVGMALMIAYVGRRYYTQLTGRVLGLGQPSEVVPTYAVWAGRALLLCAALAVVVLCQAGLDWVLASMFVVLVLLTFLILSRIVAETGLFFVQTWWMPVAVLTGAFGIEAIGPTSYIVLALASTIIVGDPRTALMPYLTNGLQIVERSGTRIRGHTSWPLLAMIVIGFFVAGLMTMGLLHDNGISVLDSWSARHLPKLPFDTLATHLGNMHAHETLVAATAGDGMTGLDSLTLAPAACLWILTGAVLVMLTALGRLRLPWWPIHPVLFLVWGTMPASRLAVSFIIGWSIKLAVTKIAGSRGYRRVVPLMVGVIAGEVLVALGWIGVGTAYFAHTGMSPPIYRIYP
ncbi:MAG: DUF6785 family protein [Phycisphaeraceae bacterium]